MGSSVDAMAAVLVAIDTERGAMETVMCRVKGPGDAYACNVLANFCDNLGAATVILQSDQEPAIMAVCEKAKSMRRSATICRQSPKYGSQVQWS